MGAMHGAPPAYAELHRREPLTRAVPGTALARAAATRKAVQITDVRKEKGYGGSGPLHVGPIKLAGARTVFAVPMVKDDELIGVIIVYRQEVRPLRQADRACQKLRRAGRDRDRECTAPERAQKSYGRSFEITAATDCNGRRAEGHQSLRFRSADGARHPGPIRCPALQRRNGQHLAAWWRWFPACGRLCGFRQTARGT